MWFKRKDDPVLAEAAEPAPQPRRQKLGWLEKRDRRRKRRRMFEEILGWILVPAFIYGIYLAVRGVGGVPKELVDFGNELIGIVMKGGR